jgi:hypothetical protein
VELLRDDDVMIGRELDRFFRDHEPRGRGILKRPILFELNAFHETHILSDPGSCKPAW